MPWTAQSSIKGPKGDTGAQGPSGGTGPQGATGPQGPSGVTTIAGASDYDTSGSTADGAVLALASATGKYILRTLTSLGAVLASQRSPFGGGPTALTVSGTGNQAINATVANRRRVTLDADYTFALPSGGVEGQEIVLELLASGADRTVTLVSDYEVSQEVPGRVFIVPSGTWARITMTLRSGTWQLVNAFPHRGYMGRVATFTTGAAWTPNAALAIEQRFTALDANQTVAAPVGAVDGETLTVWWFASGGDRTVTFATDYETTQVVPGRTLTIPTGTWGWAVIKMRGTVPVLVGAGPQTVVVTDVQEWTAPGSYQWTKPTGARACFITTIGGGGAGASGPRTASGTACAGGNSGSGAGLVSLALPATSLTATETVTVGAGGTGAAAVTTGTANAAGGAGGPSAVTGTGGVTKARALGGNGGGAVGASASGPGGGMAAGGAGVTGTSGAAGSNGGSTWGCGGGGSGGGLATSPASLAGGSGQTSHSGNLTGGTAGAAAGNGGAGAATGIGAPGSGGGGGGSSSSGVGGTGGAGGAAGAGGGGGGASLSTVASGAGGNGGNGYVSIITVF